MSRARLPRFNASTLSGSGFQVPSSGLNPGREEPGTRNPELHPFQRFNVSTLQRFYVSTHDLALPLPAGLTARRALAALTPPHLLPFAPCLAVTFAGLAGLFLQLNAEFVGFVQILVYVGAVAILIVFAILLTRGAEPPSPAPIATAMLWGVGIAVAALAMMAGAVLKSPEIARRLVLTASKAEALLAFGPPSPVAPAVSVKSLGERLMGEYVLPLEVLGLLLTAAMIGAVIIAMQEKKSSP